MATLSSSRKPAVPIGRSRSSISRPSSSSPIAGESATTITWGNALNSYRKSLSEKDFKRITIPASPEDVANEVEKWQCRQSASRYARVAAAVRAGVGRMERFSASIDMLAQGSLDPGCLLWGSIRFVLTILHDAAEEYDKLCQALSRMVDCLPRIELYTETFLESELVRACVSAYYVSTLRFWTRACKFYRRHRLLNFIRVIWNDFGAEFGELESSMIENRDRVERAALAEHIGQSKVARVHQQLVNYKLLEVQQSARQKKVTAWLAPAAYDVHYYQNDLANARALRHPKTCQWIFEKHEMGLLLGNDPDDPGNGIHEESFLWIHAKPGAGKTILSSCLIDNTILEDSSRLKTQNVLYFFCKSLDVDKNNATAVVRSLLFQVYKLTQEQGMHTMTADIEKAMDESGKRRAVDFAPIWAIFVDYVKRISTTLIVLDALDECQDAENLLQAIKSLLPSKLIKIIATSRKEAHLVTQLNSSLSLEITAEDIDSDIVAYVEAKVSGSPRLSHPLIRDMIITRLSTGHSGMFLWVYLTLKELKSCFSVGQIQGVLSNLPKGLNGVYKGILQRLRGNLPTASLDLCCKVLTWVVSAVRPLKIEELRHALSLHHEIEGDTLLFEYADKDIELVCGSLVTVRQGTLQVIHLTVKEFLTSTHGTTNSAYSDLLVDPAKASSKLTLVCLKCIKDSLNESMADLASGIARLDIKLDDEALMQRQRQAPLAEYASLTWMTHLTECDGVHMLGVSKAFQAAFESPSTFHWVEACMTFQPDSVLRLLVGLEEAIEYVSGLSSDQWPEREPSCIFFTDWCYTLRHIFEEYGFILSQRPWEVHFLDLRNSFSRVGQLYEEYGDTPRRDITRYVGGYDPARSHRPKPHANRQLQQTMKGRHTFETNMFFIHDERRRLYFLGYCNVNLNTVQLFVQNAITGQRLPPVVKLDGEAGRVGYLDSHGVSPSGEYIVAVYRNPVLNVEPRSLTLIWQINEKLRFKNRLRSDPWARISFSHQCEPGLHATVASVVFLDGGYCLTPSGEIHLASGTRRPLLNSLSKRFDPAHVNVLRSFYSQNGKYLFISEKLNWDKFQVRRITLFMETSDYVCSWEDSRRNLVDVSPSGRFLVLSPAFETTLTGRGDEFLYLYDVSSTETIPLPFTERLNYYKAKYHFMKNEMELIVFTGCWNHGIYSINVFVWSDLQSHPMLRSHGQIRLELGNFIEPCHIHVNVDESTALMVSTDRVIHGVDFRTQVTFPNAPNVDDDYPYTMSQISTDGLRWAELRYGKKKAQLQTTDVSGARGPIHKLDLELSPCDEPHLLDVSFSPNLRVLVVDAQVFSIVETMNGLIATSITIQGLPELLLHYRTRPYLRPWYLHPCSISPCNSYFTFTSPGNPDAREAAPSRLYAFRVDLLSGSSARLDLHLPKDLTFVSAGFHPSQQLMLLTYSSHSIPDSSEIEEAPPIQVSIVELGSLEMKPIVLPKSRAFTTRVNTFWRYTSLPPRAEFSDCGTFVLMAFESNWTGPPHVIHELDADPVATRYYPLVYRGHPRNLLKPCGEYLIETEEVNRTSYRLVLRKVPKADLCEDDFYDTCDIQRVFLDNIVCYSPRFADSDRFLLLGKNDDEKMRLLIAPREGHALEITTLFLSFNEAKRRLEAEWEKWRALEDNETGGMGKQAAVMEENISQEDSDKEDSNEEDRGEEEGGRQVNTSEEGRSEDRKEENED